MSDKITSDNISEDQNNSSTESIDGLGKNTTVTTSDGIEFTVNTNDIIELTEDQFNDLAAIVIRRKARYIVKDGVDIVSLTSTQVKDILKEITDRIGESKDPLGENLISISEHITDDHAINPSLLRKRGWYRDTIDELYDDIVSVIKKANDVRKAKVKFNGKTKQTINTFTFTVIGVKVNGEDGEVSIALINDVDDLILAVTII